MAETQTKAKLSERVQDQLLRALADMESAAAKQPSTPFGQFALGSGRGEPDGQVVLTAVREKGEEDKDPPEVKEQRKTLRFGPPADAARQLMKVTKDTVLGTQGKFSRALLCFEGKDGQMMVDPDCRDILSLCRKAAIYVRELEATRVVGTCTLWLVPLNMPEPKGGAQWRKMHRRERKAAVVGFCLDRDKGGAMVAQMGHNNAKGHPIGFSDCPSHLQPEIKLEAVLGMIAPAMLGLPDPKYNIRVF